MSFQRLYQDYLHRVSIAPSEPRVSILEYSDIVLHLPVLEFYASLCDHVTELGVRDGHSTLALMAGLSQNETSLSSAPPKLVSYDIEISPTIKMLQRWKNEGGLPCDWEFHQGDTANPNLNIEYTDFLFVDTLHTHEHVKKELNLWGRMATRFIGFHDTFTCGERDESGPDRNAKGIMPAINEFLREYPGEYELVYKTIRNNGMMIFERK